ncbi:MAG: biopolymer transporter ExbD [Bacteroidota bacterium]
MAKVKPHRTSPSLDMTPMVDLAFLLVTFFMLTTKFNPEEPVAVDMPKSTAEIRLPDTNILTILIAKDGKVFYNMDNKLKRAQLIREIGSRYSITFTPEQVERFSVLPSFGLPVANLPEYLDAEPEARKELPQPGIPVDSLNNQLKDWLVYSRMVNPGLRIAIKGDGAANYPVIKKIIGTLQDNNISRFNLITNLESAQ